MNETYQINIFGKYQKCRNVTNDVYYTPDDLAKLIVEHFKPSGKILEPCAGNGVFLKYLNESDWCEIDKGKNFFSYRNKVNWIVTNPPFSKLTSFLVHSMKLSDNIVFLINLPALFTVKRVREIFNYHFAIKEVFYVKQPDTWKQTGRQLAAVHLKKRRKAFSTTMTRFTYSSDFSKPYRKFKIVQ